jgi:hypothetical protein
LKYFESGELFVDTSVDGKITLHVGPGEVSEKKIKLGESTFEERISGLEEDKKSQITDFAHNHSISDTTNLQAELNGRAPINATLTDAAEVNTLPATTSTALTALLQTIRNNLKYLFNKKSDTGHTHTKNQITDFAHTHNISDTTNLQTTLDGKASNTDVVKLTGTQTIAGTKTFSTSPVVPSKNTAAGNNATTIATESQVYLKANDSDVVKLSGNQTIVGIKTFNGNAIMKTDTDYGIARARNISCGTDDLTAGVSSLASGDIYIVYE